MIDSIKLIDDKYFLLSKSKINQYLDKAKIIWGKNASINELKKLNDEYEKELTEIKCMNDIRFNEHTAWTCMYTVLHNFREEPFEYKIITTNPDFFITDLYSASLTVGFFIESLPRMEIDCENIINILDKYFKNIIA